MHAGIIWVFSSRTGTEVGLPPPYDKAAHFFSFALLGFLFAKSFNNPRIGFLVAALYGIADEIHQSFVPMRDADFWDWVADALGAYFGAGSIKVSRSNQTQVIVSQPMSVEATKNEAVLVRKEKVENSSQ